MNIKDLTGLTKQQMVEGIRYNRDAYQRDYDSSRTGFGRRPREDDEYVNGDQDEVGMQKQHMDAPHDVHINGKKWKSFGSHSHATNVAKKIKGATVHKSVEESAKHGLYYNVNKRKKAGTSRPASSPKAPTAQAWRDAAKTAKKESVAEGGAQQAAIAIAKKKSGKYNKEGNRLKETASAGATSAASIGTVDAPHISPGKARGKKSYTGTPGHSGTKAPPQPKVVQSKNKNGTAKNGLDIKSVSVFGGPKNEAQVIKRR
jgi:hypothetical protein